MSYNLDHEKKVVAVAALAEGNSIRSIERQTGVHRDTIMRLGVRVGETCTRFMDERMHDLPCTTIQMDEIWGFVGKKQGHMMPYDDPDHGDVYTFVSLCADTKLVPSFLVGKRTGRYANVFVSDLATRLRNRPQLSSDSLSAYVEAVEEGFGDAVDYGQVVKVYGASELEERRRYSPAKFFHATRQVVSGAPDMAKISTSFIESQNLTIRMHCRRLTRLTNAFSKKLDNFKAAVGLHFAYYNFVRRHNSVRMTPAMAAGVANDYMTVSDLVKLVE